MSAVFETLPGIEVPVGSINARLDAMWSDGTVPGEKGEAADTPKATQVNFVLHLGFKTTPADAVEQFRTVVRFAQRYPSRIVVLCPIADEAHSGTDMRAKIYGECFLGKSKSDKRCVEFVLLSYPYAARQFLEDQVSICLSADLPMYYWVHRFSSSKRLADYQYLLGRAKRVLLDSGVSPEDALSYPWPKPEALRDLAYARLLPVRQSMGQFLASYAPAAIIEQLAFVTISHGPNLAAEARALLSWLQRRLTACGASHQAPFKLAVAAEEEGLGVVFEYTRPEKFFRWSGNLATQHALFEANLSGATTRLPAGMSVLSPEAALSEAMFF